MEVGVLVHLSKKRSHCTLWHTVGTRVVLLYLSCLCGTRVSMVELGGIETPS
jgi:hypothetical protein